MIYDVIKMDSNIYRLNYKKNNSIEDKLKSGYLTILLNDLYMAEKNKGKQLTLDEEYKIIHKNYNQALESLECSKQSKRKNIIEENNIKVSLVEKYKKQLEAVLPKKMNENDILIEIKNFVQTLDKNSFSMKDKGLFMKNLVPKLKGKADGKIIDKTVTKYLLEQ